MYLKVDCPGDPVPGLKGALLLNNSGCCRLSGSFVGTTIIDLGSNDELAWSWRKQDPANQIFYCRHKDRQSLKLIDYGNEITKALLHLFGMAKFDPTRKFRLESKENTIRLIEEPTQFGNGLQRITILDSDHPRESQIIGYEVVDAKTGRIHLKASIQKTSLNEPKISDSKKANYPKIISFEFPVAQFNAILTISSEVTINGNLPKDVFDLPKMPKIKAVNLADQPPK